MIRLHKRPRDDSEAYELMLSLESEGAPASPSDPLAPVAAPNHVDVRASLLRVMPHQWSRSHM